MKQFIFILLILVGCSLNSPSGTNDLILDEQELRDIGLKPNPDHEDIQQLNETGCRTEVYGANEQLTQYSICSYDILDFNDSEVIIELKKFTQSLNGSYQYESSHLFSSEGLISENTFGDQSKFLVNTEKDYGGEFNEDSITYYHLWITKDDYLIHITSSGSKEADEVIKKIGKRILSKFK